MRRWVALAIGISVAFIAACGEEDHPPTLEPRVRDPGFFGINGQNLQPMAADGRAALLDRHLRAIAGLGFDFVRASFSWPAVEPRAPTADGRHYNFAVTDAWVASLARHGLRWHATVKGNPTPAWALGTSSATAACGERAPPAGDADFVALAAAIASRYGHDGSFWADHPELPRHPLAAIEIWNEPNFGIFWCPRPDPVAYASLLAGSAAAIHAADPDTRIVLGGLAGFRTGSALPGQAPRMGAGDFLAAVAAAEPRIAGEIAAIGVHLYGANSQEVAGKLAWLREAADAAKLGGIPFSVNEIGWRVGGGEGRVSEEQRATLIRDAVVGVAVSGCDVSDVAAHTWITDERDPLDPEDWFGLADPVTAEPYGSAESFADLASELRQGHVIGKVPEPTCAP